MAGLDPLIAGSETEPNLARLRLCEVMKPLVDVSRYGDRFLKRYRQPCGWIIGLAFCFVVFFSSHVCAQSQFLEPVSLEQHARGGGSQRGDDRGSAVAGIRAARRSRNIRNISPFADYVPVRREPITSDTFSLPNVEVSFDDEATQNGAEDSPLPPEVDLEGQPYVARVFENTSFAWWASDLFSNPLYFEDAPLERYGHSYCDPLQPFVSAGLFSTQLVGLPYQMAIDPFCSKMHSLGWYRPGECTPHKFYQVPLSLRAAAAQARVMAGMVVLLP